MNFQDILDSLPNPFETTKVKCESDQVSMDDPAYAKLDPHLKYDEIDRAGEGDEMPGLPRKSPRKPPSFDTLLNPIKSITKKIEHIKGFRFEVGGSPSPKFHMVHSWNIQPSGGHPAGPQGKGQIGTYMLACQYIGGHVDPFNPNPAPPKLILTGRIDSAGKLEGALIKPFDEKTQLRVTAMFPTSDMNYSMIHCDLDYEGMEYFETFF